jgi:hypothetical protein
MSKYDLEPYFEYVRDYHGNCDPAHNSVSLVSQGGIFIREDGTVGTMENIEV